jgi:hypothetical protein
MNDIDAVMKALKQEQKTLKKRLKKIGKTLRNLRGVDVLIREARSGFERGRTKYSHSPKARRAIARAQRARWKELKKAAAQKV